MRARSASCASISLRLTLDSTSSASLRSVTSATIPTIRRSPPYSSKYARLVLSSQTRDPSGRIMRYTICRWGFSGLSWAIADLSRSRSSACTVARAFCPVRDVASLMPRILQLSPERLMTSVAAAFQE